MSAGHGLLLNETCTVVLENGTSYRTLEFTLSKTEFDLAKPTLTGFRRVKTTCHNITGPFKSGCRYGQSVLIKLKYINII